MTAITTEILRLVSENELSQAIDLLKKEHATHPNFSEIILLESRFQEFNEVRRKGAISYDDGVVETSKIRKELVHTVEFLEKYPNGVPGSNPAATAPESGSKKPDDWRGTLIFFSAFILIVVIMTQCPSKIFDAQKIDNQPVASNNPTKLAPKVEKKTVNFEPQNFRIRATYVGEMQGTLEKITVEPYNNDSKMVSFYFKIMYPYGGMLLGAPIFLEYAGERKAPDSASNTFFKAGETGRGQVDFTIPISQNELTLDFGYGAEKLTNSYKFLLDLNK